MKRRHRKRHLLIWLILPAIMLGTLYLAWEARPPAPLTDPLPDVLLEETG